MSQTPSDFEHLFHQVPCGILTFRVDGTILEINQTLLEWLGLSGKTGRKENFFDLLDRGGQFYYHLFVQPILKLHNKIAEINMDIQTSDGSFPCLFNASVCHSATTNDEIIYASIFKITDRKKFENELLFKRTLEEKEKQKKAKALEEVAYDQAHLVRGPLANILGLVSLLDQAEVDEDTKKILSLLNHSSQQLDEVIKRIVDKTYQ